MIRTLWARWRARRYLQHEGAYRTQIQSLKHETALTGQLPAIKPLRAEKAKSHKRRGRVAAFRRGPA